MNLRHCFPQPFVFVFEKFRFTLGIDGREIFMVSYPYSRLLSFQTSDQKSGIQLDNGIGINFFTETTKSEIAAGTTR